MSSVENTSTTPASGGNVSRFVGKYWTLLGYSLFIGIMSAISLGFATPWAFSLYHKWTHANTDIDGDRLRFEGRGSGLYPQWAGFVVVFLVLLFAGGIIIGIGLSGFDHGLSRFGPQQAMTPVLASLLLFAAGLVMVFVGTGAACWLSTAGSSNIPISTGPHRASAGNIQRHLWNPAKGGSHLWRPDRIDLRTGTSVDPRPAYALVE